MPIHLPARFVLFAKIKDFPSVNGLDSRLHGNDGAGRSWLYSPYLFLQQEEPVRQ